MNANFHLMIAKQIKNDNEKQFIQHFFLLASKFASKTFIVFSAPIACVRSPSPSTYLGYRTILFTFLQETHCSQ